MSLVFVIVECPCCGLGVLVSAENGKHDFECNCGYIDTITISD